MSSSRLPSDSFACSLKVCDFGLARGVAQQPEGGLGELTEYVVTRWYRAPEVMLATQTYSHAIDVWAVGCIHAEILGVKPLFPGEDYISQLKLIIDVLGSPGEEDMGFIKSSRARAFMAKHAGRKRVPLSALFPKANPVGLDLLARMLEFNPARRITVEVRQRRWLERTREALLRPLFAPLVTCPVPFSRPPPFPSTAGGAGAPLPGVAPQPRGRAAVPRAV